MIFTSRQIIQTLKHIKSIIKIVFYVLLQFTYVWIGLILYILEYFGKTNYKTVLQFINIYLPIRYYYYYY